MERFPLGLPGSLSMVTEEGEEKTFEVVTENISSDGASFMIDNPLPVGTFVKIHLVLSFKFDFKSKEKRSYLNISGKVLRTYERGVVVRFDQKYKLSL